MSSYVNNCSMDFPTFSSKNPLKDSFTDFPCFSCHDLLSSLFSVRASRNSGCKRRLTKSSSRIPLKRRKMRLIRSQSWSTKLETEGKIKLFDFRLCKTLAFTLSSFEWYMTEIWRQSVDASFAFFDRAHHSNQNTVFHVLPVLEKSLFDLF